MLSETVGALKSGPQQFLEIFFTVLFDSRIVRGFSPRVTSNAGLGRLSRVASTEMLNRYLSGLSDQEMLEAIRSRHVGGRNR